MVSCARSEHMIPRYDNFRIDDDGHPCWVQAISTLDDAKTRVAELMKSQPSEFLIVSHETQHKLSIEPNPDCRWIIVNEQ